MALTLMFFCCRVVVLFNICCIEGNKVFDYCWLLCFCFCQQIITTKKENVATNDITKYNDELITIFLYSLYVVSFVPDMVKHMACLSDNSISFFGNVSVLWFVFEFSTLNKHKWKRQ